MTEPFNPFEPVRTPDGLLTGEWQNDLLDYAAVGGQASVEVLLALLDSALPTDRGAVAFVIAEMSRCPVELLPFLEGLLDDQYSRTRDDALSVVVRRAPELPLRTLYSALRLVNDPHPAVKEKAIRISGKILDELVSRLDSE